LIFSSAVTGFEASEISVTASNANNFIGKAILTANENIDAFNPIFLYFHEFCFFYANWFSTNIISFLAYAGMQHNHKSVRQ